MARMEFRSPVSQAVVTLYPMVHVGEQAFYDDVFRDAFSQDVVLMEGLKSPVSRYLTRSYRWLNLNKLGLIVQPKTPPQEAVVNRLVRADLTADEFQQEWRKISLLLRACLVVLASLIGAQRHFFMTRESLADNMSLEDLHSAEELLNWNPRFDHIYHAILHARDVRLVECLDAELNDRTKKRVAIVYGAGHMRRVVRELEKRGFHTHKAAWHLIFSV